jgi:hydrogenase expression/formation protein HypE
MKKPFQLHCPLPQIDFEVVTLGHGSGGLMMQRLLDSLVFKALSNPFLDKRHDGAILEENGKLAFTTDSFVVSPPFFPGGDIGDLAVNGTINDLAVCGADPKYLSLGFILEEGLAIEAFWQVLWSIRLACEKAKVQIVTGDTKVVEKGKGDQLFINTSGIGKVHPMASIDPSLVCEGDLILVSGPVASHGMAIMSVREGLAFESEIKSDTKPVHQVTLSLIDKFGNGIRFLRDATRGGLASTLCELAETCKYGIDITESDIPVLEEVEAACEILGLDPLYVANEGVFIAVVNPDISEEVLSLMKSHSTSAQTAIIGQIVSEHPGRVVMTSKIGGLRPVTRLVGEQLPRIC